MSLQLHLCNFLTETLNVNKNYQIKWYGQERHRRLVLLKLLIHMVFANSLWKSEQTEQTGCGNFLSLNLYVIRMSLSTAFVFLYLDSETLWLHNLSFDLISKWLLKLELPSSQRQNDNRDLVCCFWSLVDIDKLII